MLEMVENPSKLPTQETGGNGMFTLAITRHDLQNPLILAADEFTKQGATVIKTDLGDNSSLVLEWVAGKTFDKKDLIMLQTEDSLTREAFSMALRSPEMRTLVNAYKGMPSPATSLLLPIDRCKWDESMSNRVLALYFTNCAITHSHWAKISTDLYPGHKLAQEEAAERATKTAESLLSEGQVTPSEEEIRGLIREVAIGNLHNAARKLGMSKS